VWRRELEDETVSKLRYIRFLCRLVEGNTAWKHSDSAICLNNFLTNKFKSNVLEAISELKLKNSKNILFYSSRTLASLPLYRHMKLHSKQPVKEAAL